MCDLDMEGLCICANAFIVWKCMFHLLHTANRFTKLCASSFTWNFIIRAHGVMGIAYFEAFGSVDGTKRSQHTKHPQNFDNTDCVVSAKERRQMKLVVNLINSNELASLKIPAMNKGWNCDSWSIAKKYIYRINSVTRTTSKKHGVISIGVF